MLKHALYCSFLIGMGQYPVALNAQKKLETTITVPNNAIRVDALFDLFSKEADLEFSINSKRINLAQMIYVTHHSQTVTGWLQDLSAATGISYKIKGDHVILEDKRTTVLPVKANHTIAGEEKDKSKNHRIETADEEKTQRTSASSDEEKTTPKDNDDKEKYKEGLINLIKEDLHTVYSPKRKKTIDRSIHPTNTEKAVMPVTDSSTPAPPLQGLIKVDMGFAGISIGSERRIGHNMMIDLAAGLGGGYSIYDNQLNYTFPGEPMVFVSINPRVYINRNKRASAGRKTRLNAGSYIGFRLKLNVPLIEPGASSEAYLANIHWGIQRPIARKWLLNGHAGIGYALGSSAPREFNDKGIRFFYPALECRLSYVINKPR